MSGNQIGLSKLLGTGLTIAGGKINASGSARPLSTQTNVSGTATLAPGTDYDLTLSGATTLALGGATAGSLQQIGVIIRQGTTGGNAITLPTGVKWQGGTAPTLSTAANAIAYVVFRTTDGGTTWLGSNS